MFAEIDGTPIHYVSYGEGPPVVFVHGLGGTNAVWHGVMQAMRQHHHCVALDLRGHGRSGGKGKFSIEGWSRDVGKLIRHLELPSVSLVGHSLGTLVVQHLALEQPEVVEQLALVGGISHLQPQTTDAYKDRAEVVEKDGLDAIVDDWLAGAVSPQSHAVHSGMVGLLRDVFLRNDPAMYAKAVRALTKPPKLHRDELGLPVLLVTGTHDRSTPLAMAEELQREIPVTRLKVLPDVGHWVPVEDPGGLAAVLLEFLT